MVLRIRCKQQLHIGKILLPRLNRLVVALQTDIEPVGKEQAAFLRHMGIVAIHAGKRIRDGRVLGCRGLVLFDNFLVALPTKSGSGGLQNSRLVRHMGSMALGAPGDSDLVLESCIREPRTHV